MDDALLTVAETAQRLRRTPRTLYTWRQKAFGPTAFRIGGQWHYQRSEVEAFVRLAYMTSAQEYVDIAKAGENADD